MPDNHLYYGDNLQVLRDNVPDDSVRPSLRRPRSRRARKRSTRTRACSCPIAVLPAKIDEIAAYATIPEQSRFASQRHRFPGANPPTDPIRRGSYVSLLG